jgi:hypothetical protein
MRAGASERILIASETELLVHAWDSAVVMVYDG